MATPAPVWTSGNNVAVIGMPVGGGKASVSLNGTTVKFKRNHKNKWPTDAQAVTVGTMGGNLKILFFQVPGEITLIVTNGYSTHFISYNEGISWLPLATL